MANRGEIVAVLVPVESGPPWGAATAPDYRSNTGTAPADHPTFRYDRYKPDDCRTFAILAEQIVYVALVSETVGLSLAVRSPPLINNPPPCNHAHRTPVSIWSLRV